MCIAADLKNYAVGRPYYTHVLRAINEMSIFLHYDGMYCIYTYKIQAVHHTAPHRRCISACKQCTVRTALLPMHILVSSSITKFRSL